VAGMPVKSCHALPVAVLRGLMACGADCGFMLKCHVVDSCSTRLRNKQMPGLPRFRHFAFYDRSPRTRPHAKRRQVLPVTLFRAVGLVARGYREGSGIKGLPSARRTTTEHGSPVEQVLGADSVRD
jgi:hypothetical protein